MRSKKIGYDQNLIDFVLQYYGNNDKVIDFIAMNNLKYDEFGNKDRYFVENINDNDVVNFYINAREDVISGLDTSGYSNLYPDPTYYIPNTGTPSSVIIPDPNIIAFDTTTEDFAATWTNDLNGIGYGDVNYSNDQFTYTLDTGLTLGLFYKDDTEKDLTIGDYRITFTIESSVSFTAQTYLGGFVILSDNFEALYYSSGSGSTQIIQNVSLVDGEQQYINNEWWFQIFIAPAGSSIIIKDFEIYKTG